APSTPAAPSPGAGAAFDPAVIAAAWPDGCFTIRDAAGRTYESDPARCALPRRPYSTFKVPSALIGIDAGLFDGPDAPMTWDAKRLPKQDWWMAAWSQPHTLRSGMAVSAVPHFQTLALTLGEDRLRAGLAKLDYGNRDISGGLHRFWLGGGLRISARQQLALVDGLARGSLAVSPPAQAIVREITVLARDGDRRLHGKTGSGSIEDAMDGEGWLVWQVGWIAHAGTVIPYAGWLEVKTGTLDDARAARTERIRGTLATLGVFPRTAGR
nr:penicillin-binding transpeptidase domain-containing protein [Myxococcota bacterium]